ncbi:MAG: kelch motif-containing protein [Actinobacteria bacterium]|nr:kelch motif-containing protein [Actinomycetota bacterium]
MPRGLNYVVATGYDGKIYAIGGFAGGDEGAVSDVYAYDVASDT